MTRHMRIRAGRRPLVTAKSRNASRSWPLALTFAAGIVLVYVALAGLLYVVETINAAAIALLEIGTTHG